MLRIGDKVTDFVIERSDGNYVLCEIENVTKKILLKDGHVSGDLKHACEQVEEWCSWIAENLSTAQGHIGLTGTLNPKRLVIMGRTADIPVHKEAQRRWRIVFARTASMTVRYILTTI